jgi:hypothetical protein
MIMRSSTKRSPKNWILLAVFTIFVISACQKQIDKPATQQQSEEVGAANKNKEHGHLKQTKTFSSDVVVKWLNLDLDLIRLPLPAGVTAVQGGERILAYSGIALYEAVVNGMPAYQSLNGQLTASFPSMPTTDPGKGYHWAAAANAALAEVTRYLFDVALPTPTNPQVRQERLNKINALESTLQDLYANDVDGATLELSVSFGKEVGKRISVWADGDGYKIQGGSYNPPTPQQPWHWVPTAAAPAVPINPNVSNRRLLVHGSDNGATIAPFPPFSTTPGSEFYEMANDVYTKSLSPSDEHKNLALYFRDAGEAGYYGGSGHYIAILSQVISKSGASLDIAALAFAKSGIAVNDAFVVGFITKYTFYLLRPITYLRNFAGHPTWSPLIATPNHPEFPSAHSFHAGGFLTGLADVFGDNFEFTDNTYANMPTSLLPPGTTLKALPFHSFTELKKAIGDSRVYAGIHYAPACTEGIQLGEKVAQNVLNTLKFLKE